MNKLKKVYDIQMNILKSALDRVEEHQGKVAMQQASDFLGTAIRLELLLLNNKS